MLIHEHSFKLEELDNMLPWEREIYISLVEEYVKRENERRMKQQKKHG